MSTKRKVALLVLDAASPELLRRWAASGAMPSLARLLRAGRSAGTLGPEGFFVGATWPTFYMGLDPSHHGIYWLDRLLPGTYRTQRCTSGDFGRHPALWDVLEASGLRTLVLDVPLSRLSPALRGVQVLEWGVHDEVFGLRTRPSSTRRRILAEVGPHPVPSSCDAPSRTLPEYVAFADALVAGAAARARLTRSLIETEAWDFLIQVFSECHCAGHQLWHFHDERHPGFHGPDVQTTGNLVERVYRGVDEALGAVVASLPAGTTVVVATLHGMAHACGAAHLLDSVLDPLAATTAGPAPHPAPSASGTATERLAALYRRLPEGVRRPIHDLRQAVNQHVLARGSPLGFDTSRVRAWHVGMGLGSPWSGVRLNLRGREPSGIVEPGAQEDALVASLRDGLCGIVDADTGTPAVREVRRTGELYDGPMLGALPDLLVGWNPDFRLGSRVLGRGAGARCRLTSPRIGRVEAVNGYGRAGEHRREGMVVVAGDGIGVGALPDPVSTIDLAPTLAAMLGCRMPTSTGRPLRALIGPEG